MEIRLIDRDGNNEGVIDVDTALKRAQELSLDLVMVSSSDECSTCKIMDYSKYVFEKEKKSKRQHKRKIRTKEYSFQPTTEYHDIDIMINKCIKNLNKGHRILFLMKFTQRQRKHKEVGIEKLKYVEKKLNEVAIVEKKDETQNSISFLFINKPKD